MLMMLLLIGHYVCELRDWFNLLCSRGPAFGYFPEPTKSFLVVNEQWKNQNEATTILAIWGFRWLLVIDFLLALSGVTVRGRYTWSLGCATGLDNVLSNHHLIQITNLMFIIP